MKNCVYRFLNKDNEIIYIGKAADLNKRISCHNHLPKECYEERKKIEYIQFNNEQECLFAEKYLIIKNKPKYNIDFKDIDFILNLNDFDELKWNKYRGDNYIKREYKRKNSNFKRINSTDKIFIDNKWLNRYLFKSDKDKIVNELSLCNKNNRQLKWTSIKRILKEQGYKIEDKAKKINGKTVKVSIIEDKEK